MVATTGDSRKVGIRISPMGTFGDVHDANPLETFSYLVEQLNSRQLGYLHVNRPDWLGGTFEGYDALLRKLRQLYQGTLIIAGGQTAESGEQAIAEGLADLVAYGRPYIANPDLAARFQAGAELNPLNPATLYGGGAEGYTDYPALG